MKKRVEIAIIVAAVAVSASGRAFSALSG